jgi:hypothetical protein
VGIAALCSPNRSGRAIIYAQARTLLVSHWSIGSKTVVVKLITKVMAEMAADAKGDRAEALRHATLALIDRGDAHETHPAF